MFDFGCRFLLYLTVELFMFVVYFGVVVLLFVLLGFCVLGL